MWREGASECLSAAVHRCFSSHTRVSVNKVMFWKCYFLPSSICCLPSMAPSPHRRPHRRWSYHGVTQPHDSSTTRQWAWNDSSAMDQPGFTVLILLTNFSFLGMWYSSWWHTNKLGSCIHIITSLIWGVSNIPSGPESGPLGVSIRPIKTKCFAKI